MCRQSELTKDLHFWQSLFKLSLEYEYYSAMQIREGKIQMRRFVIFGLISAALLCCRGAARAQDKAFQEAVLQKLNELDNKMNALEKRLDEMDKRYEVRFATLETKLEAVNQRIDDKFNLIVGLLGLLTVLLALPYIPRLLENFRARPQNQEDIKRLEEQIEQIKKQLAQLSRPA
jgi:septal ring factor EnvC (AmiA/AmiB activator)